MLPAPGSSEGSRRRTEGQDAGGTARGGRELPHGSATATGPGSRSQHNVGTAHNTLG